MESPKSDINLSTKSDEEIDLKIAVPREITEGENRVAVVPSMVSLLMKNNNEVFVETGAGMGAFYSDVAYKEAGAVLVDNVEKLFKLAEVVLKVRPPCLNEKKGFHEADLFSDSSVFIGLLDPLKNFENLRKFTKHKITAFAMEFIPRISRAQSMDVLSSQATAAGYKAVLTAADHIGKFFPLLMTAAGTIPPATVLVLGAGVAGLQAIATAKRLGAKVQAFDPRPVVQEQVESLGAYFIKMELPGDVETAGGYAKGQSDEFLRKEQEAIGSFLDKADVVITTAQVFGKKAPILITDEMLKAMSPGSIIVDLAAEQGGNCSLTEAGETVVKNGVTVIGAANLPSALPTHASRMYSKNIANFFQHAFQKTKSPPDFSDEIIKGACITHNGEVVNEMAKKMLKENAHE